MVTTGDAIVDVYRFLPPGATTYTAADVLTKLLGEPLDLPPTKAREIKA
jgi:hypothetical protein